MVKVEEYPEGTAERALAEFVTLWKRRQWEALAEKCQVSWKTKQWGQPVPVLLRLQLAHYRLVDARLGEARPVSDVADAGGVVMRMNPTRLAQPVDGKSGVVAVDVPVTIDYEVGKGVASITLLARVICESAPFTPDAGGTWGVNPTSLARVV